ncbi:MAG: 16S rRNA (guanine(527)-N(7))-methyltransferase RsmG [Acidobacteria bacterium]|nr:16S rRNA (guanine(527)-N(7))-methyltransferase RsmG [Acidobacteriota bacterium]
MTYFSTIIENEAINYDIYITQSQISSFKAYFDALCHWNIRINLTSITKTNEIARIHFLESSYLAHAIPSGIKICLDIGSGAGFPGLPLAVLLPNLRVHLLESSSRKCAFLKEVIRLLDLKTVEVLNFRLEKLLKEGSLAQYDLLTMRAISLPPKLISRMVEQLHPEGWIALFHAHASEIHSQLKRNLHVVDRRCLKIPQAAGRFITLFQRAGP